MPTDEEYDSNIIELNLNCNECGALYSIYTDEAGFADEARYCPFCGTYNIDYDRVEDNEE